MARFYAEIQGNRGPASRMGTPQSGMWAHVRGWDVGAKVRCYAEDDDTDVVCVDVSGGSNKAHGPALATIIHDGEGTKITVYTPDGPVRWTL